VDRFVALGSRHDLQHLVRLRDEAAGVLFGASTLRTWPRVHRGTDPTRPLHHFLMSRSLDLDLHSELFQHPDVPLTIISSSARNASAKTWPEHVEVITVKEGPEQVQNILKHIEEYGISSLLVEGGGHVLQQFIQAQVLDELYLTLVPKVIGDVHAPALLAGVKLDSPPKIQVLDVRQVEDETYLHLAFKYG